MLQTCAHSPSENIDSRHEKGQARLSKRKRFGFHILCLQKFRVFYIVWFKIIH